MSSEFFAISMPALLAVAFGTPLATPVDNAQELPGAARRLLTMTPEQFEQSATLKDDSLETEATISTVNGWQQKDGLLKIVNNDGFFRAFINKASGKTTFQVYHVVRYRAHGWARFSWVNYETPDGPQSARLKPLGRIREPCTRYAGCTYVEHVGFDVEEALLRTVAGSYRAGRSVAWRYRLKAKSGMERDEAFVAAEVAGLLRAVDKYRATKKFPARKR